MSKDIHSIQRQKYILGTKTSNRAVFEGEQPRQIGAKTYMI